MIPPHELKNKEFTRVIRGYSIPEVDEYISFVMEKYTDLYRENDALERKLQSALDALDAMRAEEESIRTALINAQKAGKQIVADASDRADKIMRSTKSDCMRVLAEFRDKAAAERKTLLELKTSIASLKEEMFEKYRMHIEFLEQLTPGADLDAAAMQMTDNDAYIAKISDSIAELVREDFDFDITDTPASAPAEKDERADTQVFDKPVQAPAVTHVSLEDLMEDTASDVPAVKTKAADADEEDADSLLEALAADLEDDILVTDEQLKAVYGSTGSDTDKVSS